MRKTIILLFSSVLLSGVFAWAGPVEFTITLNTASIAGTNGSLDFALYPGAGSDQVLTATVFDFLATGGSYGGVKTPTGNVTGGPVITGNNLTLLANTLTQDNDELESFKFGSTLSFVVALSGPALTAPDGLALSPEQFIFSTYSDAAGTIPVLTTDPGGAAGIINISAQGVASTSAVASGLSIVASPEPASFCMLASALLLSGAFVCVRRRGLPHASRLQRDGL